MSRCPHCGGDLAAPAAHRGELERQLGDATLAQALRDQAAASDPERPTKLLDGESVAWRGHVWAKVRVRKPAVCAVSGEGIGAGSWAWRQLSEVSDRDLRVSTGCWASL